MTPIEVLECVLCHRVDRDVTVALLAYRGDAAPYYGTDPRCPDHEACRVRMESDGDEWPLLSKAELDRRSREAVR